MRLALGGIRSALIVAPHPDDEIIGGAGLIAALRLRGATVRVVIVSDGGASHPGSTAWPRARLVAERRRESRRALLRLAVPADAVTFVGLPDGALAAQGEACRRTLRRLVAQTEPTLIVAPAASDAHPDHRAVAAALREIRTPARRLDYQVWPPRGRHPRAITLVVARGAAAKRSLIRAHRTQLGAIRDDPAGFAIARHELAAFAHPLERFVAQQR
ncbi:PIG-L family deacetylase [Sphingomonas sp. NBWT7]|uniref:PIG-L deacetylase family protein n=1 Tax=Sphingomonas sp. NBWT7 TaxID=2596913 RepID=UPI001628DBD5|nr:PIG-L family deacetylase [Sphingomonas sp. NBWT7]QNE32140.1 PIG-L family deacetylase [Sphingomonas sp. NBWT7]